MPSGAPGAESWASGREAAPGPASSVRDRPSRGLWVPRRSGGFGRGLRPCRLAAPARAVTVRARGAAPGRVHDAEPSTLRLALRLMEQLLVLEPRLGEDVLALLECFSPDALHPIGGAEAGEHHSLGRRPRLVRKRRPDEGTKADEYAPRQGSLQDFIDHLCPPAWRATGRPIGSAST